MNEFYLTINRVAQGRLSLQEGLAWFDHQSDAGRSELMRSLDMCIAQSHPKREEIIQGITRSGLRDTYSPCVVVLRTHFNEARQKVLNMSGLDQRRAFQLFVSIFAIADARRREVQCRDGCTHDWHHL